MNEPIHAGISSNEGKEKHLKNYTSTKMKIIPVKSPGMERISDSTAYTLNNVSPAIAPPMLIQRFIIRCLDVRVPQAVPLKSPKEPIFTIFFVSVTPALILGRGWVG